MKKRITICILSVIVAVILCTSGMVLANEFSNTLRFYSETKRADVLCGIVNSAGYSCSRITLTFYNGVDKRSDTAYWAVSCTNGVSYSVQISSKSATRVIPCKTMNLLGLKCFKKYE
jgi:hypothetical protein